MHISIHLQHHVQQSITTCFRHAPNCWPCQHLHCHQQCYRLGDMSLLAVPEGGGGGAVMVVQGRRETLSWWSNREVGGKEEYGGQGGKAVMVVHGWRDTVLVSFRELGSGEEGGGQRRGEGAVMVVRRGGSSSCHGGPRCCGRSCNGALKGCRGKSCDGGPGGRGGRAPALCEHSCRNYDSASPAWLLREELQACLPCQTSQTVALLQSCGHTWELDLPIQALTQYAAGFCCQQ